jgi:hypothetical protein
MKEKKLAPLGQSSWLLILCLIGLDYFSSLAYQPSLAFESAGLLAPLATVVVVVLTLGGAVPVYAYVAGRSPEGKSTVGLLEQAVPGWIGKFLVLTLLGFAATDFVLTRTLSAADAAVHLIHNPQPAWQETLQSLGRKDNDLAGLLPPTLWQRIAAYWNEQLIITLILSALSFVFWAFFRRGFTRRVIQLSVYVVAFYLLVNGLVIGSGIRYLARHPEYLQSWWWKLEQGLWHPAHAPLPPHSWSKVAILCLASFPALALGLSGFELSMVVMPLVRTRPGDDPADLSQRIRGVRKLLVTAALIMAVYLLGSALVTTTLLSPEALAPTGAAANRALAYLAHGGRLVDGASGALVAPFLGRAFGTAYDAATILVLCLAGTSVAICLRDFVPDYLHRLGMELDWAHRIGLILYIFSGINLVVTVIFRASVTAQRGAYATSVLVLIATAALVAFLDRRRRGGGPWSRPAAWTYALIGILFLASALASMVMSPAGLLIAACFIAAIVISSMVSRALRSTELRFDGFHFKDAHSQFLWESLEYLEFPVLVPHRPGGSNLMAKEERIRQRHRLAPDVPIVFVEVELGDASDFYHKPCLEVTQEDGRFVLRICRAASIPHVLAAVALELSRTGKPPEIHCGWSNSSPVEANISFLLFGQGNIPWMVRDLIHKAEPRPERRPPVVIG